MQGPVGRKLGFVVQCVGQILSEILPTNHNPHRFPHFSRHFTTHTYKLQAIQRILPRFEEKREFVTGKARKIVDTIIVLLEVWKLDFPNGTNFSNPRVERTSDI